MTEQLARELFTILLTELQENNLVDVVTFNLEDNSPELQFSGFDEKYQYDSTENEAIRLTQLAANNDGGAYQALNALARAGTAYFESARSIPGAYRKRLNALGLESEPTSIRMDLPGGEETDLSAALNNPSIDRLLQVLYYIRENQELNDERFTQGLNELTQNF